MARLGSQGHAAGTSALPPKADIRAPTISLTLGSGMEARAKTIRAKHAEANSAQ